MTEDAKKQIRNLVGKVVKLSAFPNAHITVVEFNETTGDIGLKSDGFEGSMGSYRSVPAMTFLHSIR